jgi:predicted glycosyltransferase
VAVPPQFPASLLCYNCEVVISYSSATLYEAANLGIKSISLVNLIPTTKPQQIKQVIDYLEEHLKEGEIQYPCEIESFEGIL